VPKLTLHLVHADAGAFVSGGSGRFDLIVMNELLDDLPGHVYYADEHGATRELAPHAAEQGDGWRVEVAEEPAAGVELPTGMLAASSPAGVAVVRGAASLLESGGILLVHDYGFTEPAIPASYYAEPRPLPSFVELALPPDAGPDFPRAFFRIFGNENQKVVQITTDVGFAELIAELRDSGTVITLPHGNALLATRESRDDLRKGDGVFLSEFGTLGPGDDLAGLLSRLDAEQSAIRRKFADDFLQGNPSVFADLLFVKR